MDFERTKYGEVMAFARLLNVTEEELIKDARRYRRDQNIVSISDMDDDLYGYFINALTIYTYVKADEPNTTFTERFDNEYEEEDEEDQGVSFEDWVWGEKYRDYCERVYGWDCS